jgi:type I restriction enzyme S subunit
MNYCPGIGKSSRAWRTAQREDQNNVGLAGWLQLLGDVVRFGNGKSIKPGGTGIYPVYGSNGIIGGSDEFRHENGVIIGRVGAYCGAVLYCPTKFWASDNTLVAYPSSGKVDTKFLYYLLADAKLGRFAGGAAQPLVTQTVLKQIEVRVPGLPIQQRIAGILSAYDELIENSQRRIKILEAMARTLYREWFVHFRFPGHESIPRISSSLGEIPQGWTATTLGQLVEIKKGKNITKNTAQEGSVPVVAGGLEPAYFHDTANTRAPVITISASGANAGFVNLYYTAVWASDCSYIDFSATPHVFYYYLWLDDRRSRITHLQRGSAQAHVYSRDLAQLEGVQPPNELLDAFLRNISPLFGVIRRLSAKIDNLHRTRDLLLKHLMSEQFQKGEFK